MPTCRCESSNKVNMIATLQTEQPMNTRIITYPGLQNLPKGVKQRLLVSEAHFFDQPVSRHPVQEVSCRAIKPRVGIMDLLTKPLVWKRPLVHAGIAFG